MREIKEEIDLDIDSLKLLCTDWNSPSGGHDDKLQFMFYGGVLTDAQCALIKIQANELGEFKFVSVEKALTMLNKRMSLRVPACIAQIEREHAIYLENGASVAENQPC